MSFVLEKLYMGGLDEIENVGAIEKMQISHILTVAHKPLPRQITDLVSYKFVTCFDMNDANLLDHFPECIKFIEEGRLASGICVHCMFGQSRSATIILAYLMDKLDVSLDDAQTTLMKLRPQIQPNPGFIDQLRLFELMGCKIDHTFADYKQFRLGLLASQIQKLQVLDSLPMETMYDDPSLKDQSQSVVYKCAKCRRALFHQEALVPHISLTTEDNCTQSLFINPVQWMASNILTIDGKISCPKCQSKLGSFTWTGERCPCNQWITPAFHIQTKKVDISRPAKLMNGSVA